MLLPFMCMSLRICALSCIFSSLYNLCILLRLYVLPCVCPLRVYVLLCMSYMYVPSLCMSFCEYLFPHGLPLRVMHISPSCICFSVCMSLYVYVRSVCMFPPFVCPQGLYVPSICMSSKIVCPLREYVPSVSCEYHLRVMSLRFYFPSVEGGRAFGKLNNVKVGKCIYG